MTSILFMYLTVMDDSKIAILDSIRFFEKISISNYERFLLLSRFMMSISNWKMSPTVLPLACFSAGELRHSAVRLCNKGNNHSVLYRHLPVSGGCPLRHCCVF